MGPVISIFIDLQKSGKIGMDMRQLFFILGIVAGTFGMGLFSLAGLCTKERVMQQSEEPKISDCFKCLVKNKPLLLIVCSNVLGTVESIADAFTQYFYLFTLGSASLSIVAGIPGTYYRIFGLYLYSGAGTALDLQADRHSRGNRQGCGIQRHLPDRRPLVS